jgi:hypothetical protein
MQDLLMKAAIMVAVALSAFSSFPSPAQQQDPQQPQTTTPSQQNPPAPAAPGQAQPAAPTQTQPAQPAPSIQLQPIKGALVANLDSKSAKQGDSVVVRTEETVKTASGTEIPEGSKLVGHVTNVEPRSDSQENSQIAIQFDRAELKSGQNVPIASVIQSVAPATGGATGSDNGTSSAAPGTSASGSATAAGANPTAGNGANPGSAPGSTSDSASNRPVPDSNTTAQSGASDQNANSGAPAPGTVVARTGNVAIRVTAIPGVLLANSITGQPFVNASGLLLGARRDIHLDGGTQMVVAVAEAPHAPGDGMSR